LTKLNATRHRLDQCRNPLMKSIYWNEIYCEVHLKRHQTHSSTSALSSLLSSLVAKELKKLDNKLLSINLVDQQTAQLNSNYIQLNCQFCRFVIDCLFRQPHAYVDYEQDDKIPQGKHRQLEIYLANDEQSTDDFQHVDKLIQALFDKCVTILKNNIDRQTADYVQHSVGLFVDDSISNFCSMLLVI
jgi:hypothetical protein